MPPNNQQPNNNQTQTNQETVNPQPQTNAPSVSSPNNMSQPLQPSKSHVGLIVGIVAAVVALIIVAVISYLLIFSDAAVSKRRSNSFMAAMTSGDIAAALQYTDGSSDTQAFLNSMKDGMQGQFELNESANENGTYYYLYNLSGAANQAARTELSKASGEWQVNALYTGGPNLAVKASASSEEANTSTQLAGSCLVQSDFDEWYNQEYGVTATSQGFNFHESSTPYTTNFKFQPDSLEYEDASYNQENISSIVTLAKSVEGKEFVIRLQGSVATTASSDLEFSNQRANKIKNTLIEKGVSSQLIVVEEPNNVSSISGTSEANEATKAMARNVVLKFDPTCNSSAATETGR